MKNGKKNEDFSLIASTIISKNQNMNHNMSQLPLKGKYIIILEQTFDIVAKKNKKHKGFKKFNFNKSFSLNHSYISDISSSEISKLKRNLINQKSMIREKRNKSEFNVNHIQIKNEEKNLNKSKSLCKEVNWSIKNNIDNTFLDNSTLQMMQDLNIDKEKEQTNNKKETEKRKPKNSKSPVNKKVDNKSKAKSPVNNKIDSKSKSPVAKQKKDSTKSPTGVQNIKKNPITLKKNEFAIKKESKENNKFRTAAQKIQYAPIKKKDVSKRKTSQSSFLREKERSSFIKEKESNQTTFLDKSIQTNIKKKKKKSQKDEQSVVHSEDFQASSEFTPTENENKQKHYRKIIPHRKYKKESKQSGQSTNNEIINEGKQEQSFFEKSSSLCSNNKFPFKPIIPKSKLYGYQKRATSTGQCDQKSTPSSISGCGTPFPRNTSKKIDKSYTNSTSFLQNRLVQTAKAGTARNFDKTEQLFEINERKKINSSKVRLNKNEPTFENNYDLEESKCKKRLPRGPRVPFSNISQEYIDRRKQMFMELMKDPSNPYSLYWTDRFLNKNYNMNTIVKGTVNCVPNIGLISNNNPNNSFMHLTPNDCFFDRTQRNQMMMQNELNDINIPDISYIGAGFSQPLPKKLSKSGSARLVQYPSIYKYFNSHYVY